MRTRAEHKVVVRSRAKHMGVRQDTWQAVAWTRGRPPARHVAGRGQDTWQAVSRTQGGWCALGQSMRGAVRARAEHKGVIRTGARQRTRG